MWELLKAIWQALAHRPEEVQREKILVKVSKEELEDPSGSSS
jgi:hypothetical protein